MATSEVTVEKSLKECFEEGLDLYMKLEDNTCTSDSPEYQTTIAKSRTLLENATRLVSNLGLFSDNETINELSTFELRFLLLPFVLGQLNLKLCGVDRAEVLRTAEIYFDDFIKRCTEYGCAGIKAQSQIEKSTAQDRPLNELERLSQMGQERNAKIEKFRQRKELNAERKRLYGLMKENVTDDEVIREFFMKTIEASIEDSYEELSSIQKEKEMLKYMEKMRLKGELESGRPSKPPKRINTCQVTTPIIITKDAVQQAVFGLGYPSLPTFTVQDFYNQRVSEGIFPDPENQLDSLQSRAQRDFDAEEEEDHERNDQLEEADDPDYLARKRRMDEFKDDTRRGDGNRHNRS